MKTRKKKGTIWEPKKMSVGGYKNGFGKLAYYQYWNLQTVLQLEIKILTLREISGLRNRDHCIIQNSIYIFLANLHKKIHQRD
jgi:hypothetical protein